MISASEILDGLYGALRGRSTRWRSITSAKVIAAMQKNRVNATHFAATTGYGYDDEGRDNLERVYADCFHTEAALVRPQITCGTHALAVALSGEPAAGRRAAEPRRRARMTRSRRSSASARRTCSLAEYGVQLPAG